LKIIEVIYLIKNKNKDLTIIIIDDYKFRKNYHALEKIIKVKLIKRLGIIYLNSKILINLTKIINFQKNLFMILTNKYFFIYI
jgi:hypothetical protein